MQSLVVVVELLVALALLLPILHFVFSLEIDASPCEYIEEITADLFSSFPPGTTGEFSGRCGVIIVEPSG